MNRCNFKNTAVLLQDDPNDIYCQWYSMTVDMTESNVFKPTISKSKIKAKKIFAKFPF